MSLKLVVTTNVNGDVFELILTRSRYRVGRRHDNDLRIKETYVSAYHSEILRTDDGGYELMDCGSSNGTYLNGVRIEGRQRIQSGDFIKFGILKVAVREHDGGGPTIVSLKDRPVFAKKNNDVTSSIAPNGKTGRIGKIDASTTAAPETGPAPIETISKKPDCDGEESADWKEEAAKFQARSRQLSDQLKEAKAEANQLRVDLKKAREEAAANYSETEKSLSSRIAELETALSSEQALHRDLQAKEALKREEAESAIEKLSEIEGQKERLHKRLDEVSRSSGQLQAELNRESAGRAQLCEELEASKEAVVKLRAEIEDRDKEIESRAQELAEKEKEFARNESEQIVQLKRDLEEARAGKTAVDEEVGRIRREKLALGGSFERLKEQLHSLEAENANLTGKEETLLHDKGVLARRLEKAEASNSELAAKIKEEQTNAISHRKLVSKLETQLRENESEAVDREKKRVAAFEAELKKRDQENEATSLQMKKLEEKVIALLAAKTAAEETIQSLREEKNQLGSERNTTSDLLRETQKERAGLASALDDQKQIAEERARTIAGKVSEIAALKTRFEENEAALISRHQEEREALRSEIREERIAGETLSKLLENTRAGLSDVIRMGREQAESERVRLLAEGHRKLSEVEAELGRVIHGREEAEAARDNLEDELNQREERLEKMTEQIEDLQLRLKDEDENRSALVDKLQKTREGLSAALHLNRQGLEKAQTLLLAERETGEVLRSDLAAAESRIEDLDRELEETNGKHEKEMAEWERRYDQLRREKLSLAGEDANLKRIREQIREAQKERKTIESELHKLKEGHQISETRFESLRDQREALLKEREELKAELNAARVELEQSQKRQLAAEERRGKLSESITSAEKRIASLQKLESEIEQAVERKRKQGILSRNEVFSTTVFDLKPDQGEFSREDFYRKLINKLDLIDDLSKRYGNRWRYPRVAEQLSLLKSSFLDFLHDHSVKEFNLEPGTVLSVEERKRIKLVPYADTVSKKSTSHASPANRQRSKVISTIRPGYIYRDGTRDVIIRKAEVIVA